MKKRAKPFWTLPPGVAGIYLLLSGALLLGGIAGCLFAAGASGAEAAELCDYLSDYMLVVRDGGAAGNGGALILEKLRPVFLTILFGLTSFGLIGVPALFAVQGFLYSFSVCCFYRVFGWRGFFPAFSLLGASALLWFPALFLLGAWGLERRFGDRAGAPGASSFSAGSHYPVVLCLVFVALCFVVEAVAVPGLLRAAAHVVL